MGERERYDRRLHPFRKIMQKSKQESRAGAARARLRLAPLCLLATFALAGCDGGRGGGGAAANATPAQTAAATNTGATPPSRPPFDGQRAFEHVRKMVEAGPRPAGSAELARTRQYLVGELQSANLKVTTDEWDARTPVGVKRMANVVVELPGKSQDVVIIASHYDTKPFKEFRFVGANDGGSSTGALVEIARALALTKQQPNLTYWFVFFDGEEAFCKEWDECETPDGPDNTYGSRHMVARLKGRGELQRVRAMILLDMIGYTNLRLQQDTMGTRWLGDLIWTTAREIGHGQIFAAGEEGVGGDDHEPFLREGVPAVDLIQLGGYPHWHTPEDTLDKISPRSLQVVGETVLASLPKIERNVTPR
jgi:hypothetical protein